MALTFGRVPHPSYLDRPIIKPNGFGMDLLGRRTVKGVVYHRMIGSLWGTDTYFRSPSVGALTDYGVGTTPQDGAANDGLIIRWNDPLGLQSGWASGTWDSAYAYGDGKAFVQKYAPKSNVGVSVINKDQASIEISGLTYELAITAKTKQSVAAISAYWADQYGIPWDVYPIAPQDGFSFVRWHNEFGPDHGTKKCPGQVVMDATPEIIEITRGILKQYQLDGAEVPPVTDPTPPATTYPNGMDEGVASYLFGSVKGDPNGTVYKFDPSGRISKKWLARGDTTGAWPRIASVRQFDDRKYFQFSDGYTLWNVNDGEPQVLI